MRAIETDPVLNTKYPFLCQSAAGVGSIQIRKTARPSVAIWPTPPLRRRGPESDRALRDGKNCPALQGMFSEEFSAVPVQTVMTSDEILTEISQNSPQRMGEYIKFSPRHDGSGLRQGCRCL